MTPQEYKKIKAFLSNLMYKKNGSRTKFARKYGIKNFRDFYAFFKEMKQNFKRDREGFAFGMMKDMAKSYVGRVWVRMPGKDQEQKVFNAWSYFFDMVALCLDNLKVLKKALEQMDTEGVDQNQLLESSLSDIESKLVSALIEAVKGQKKGTKKKRRCGM